MVVAKGSIFFIYSIALRKTKSSNVSSRLIKFSRTQQCPKRCFSLSSEVNASARLTPQEVNSILRANEETREFNTKESSVRFWDANQLGANYPIEDTKNEAYLIPKNGFLFGVFDGHAGGSCAQVLAKRLFHYIAACLLSKDDLNKLYNTVSAGGGSNVLNIHSSKFEFVDVLRDLYSKNYRELVSKLLGADSKGVSAAIEEAFTSLDADITREALETEANVRLNLKTLSVAMSGAVSTVAYIEGADLHVANVGDCQAVLGVLNDDHWVPKILGIQHNYENAEEVQRILHDHPLSEKDNIIKYERLFGQLAPLRAFGDVRYKWNKDTLKKYAVPHYGQSVIPPNYFTPPYLTAKPDITYHHLSPKDKFLILATDGLWDFITPLQAVRLVGEHMRGRTVLTPFTLPREETTLGEINKALLVRKDCLAMKPIDSNASTHLIRNALSATEFGLDQARIAHLLALPNDIARNFRDDITVTVVYFDAEYLRHSMLQNEGTTN